MTERYQELDPSVQDENEVENIEKSLCLPEHEEEEDKNKSSMQGVQNSANSVNSVKMVADAKGRRTNSEESINKEDNTSKFIQAFARNDPATSTPQRSTNSKASPAKKKAAKAKKKKK